MIKAIVTGHTRGLGAAIAAELVKRGVTVLGRERVRLDVNYAYNPSCAYDDAWLCPLAPEENRLEAPVEAGEMTYK